MGVRGGCGTCIKHARVTKNACNANNLIAGQHKSVQNDWKSNKKLSKVVYNIIVRQFVYM